MIMEIQGRMQHPDESFHKYATAMLTNMHRAGDFSQEDLIDRLYENMHPEYKLYVRLDDVSSLGDLSIRAAEYEAIERQRRKFRNDKKTYHRTRGGRCNLLPWRVLLEMQTERPYSIWL